jgi:DNA-directed RNA polymerase specialized sigma24 family protein
VWADVSHAERDRFSAAFEAHAAHLHDYCGSLLASRQDVADAAQATLVIAYSLLDRLQDVGQMRAWLLTLARRVCLSEKPVWSRHSGNPAEDEPETERLGQLFSTGRRSAAMTLSGMPAAEREVLDLVYRHYLSSADVAAVLGVPPDGASALLGEAVRSFERAHSDLVIDGTSNALVAGVRAISAITLVELPPSILPGAISMALDPTFGIDSAALASAVGDLGPDGFPAAPSQPVTRQVACAVRVPHPRLALLSILVLALGAAVALMASSSSGVPNPGRHVIGQSLGQVPVGGLIRRPGSLPITALLPKRRSYVLASGLAVWVGWALSLR